MMHNRETSWLNVDFPMKRAVLHRSDCRYVETRPEAEYKGIGEMKRDGGWVSFESRDHAIHYVHQQLHSRGFGPIIECAVCHP